MHFWDNADNNIVTDNIFIDNDRAIGFGMRLPNRGIRYAHKGGVAKNNVIYHTNNGDPFADVGIMAEGNIGLTVADNIIFQMHPYENAIEYRWDNSDGIDISGNMVNKRIQGRDGAVATLNSNMEMLTLEQFLIEFQKKSDLLNVIDYKHPVEGRQ